MIKRKTTYCVKQGAYPSIRQLLTPPRYFLARFAPDTLQDIIHCWKWMVGKVSMLCLVENAQYLRQLDQLRKKMFKLSFKKINTNHR